MNIMKLQAIGQTACSTIYSCSYRKQRLYTTCRQRHGSDVSWVQGHSNQ